MRITRQSGTEILAQFRSSGDIARFPVMVFLLVPDLEEDELDELVRQSRIIDRVTGALILVVLFSKPPERESRRRSSGLRMRQRMIEGDVTESDRRSLLRGFVDEANALATALEIPLSNLPCIVIIDNPNSLGFYRLQYKGVKEFDRLSRSIVDHIRKKFPDYAKLRDEERQIEETLGRAANGTTKRQRKAASKHCECIAVLDRTLASLPDEGRHSATARRSLQYLKDNPADHSAMQKLEEMLVQLGIPSPASEFSREWARQSEILAFGSPVEELEKQLHRTRAAIAALPRPDLASLLARVATLEVTGKAATSLERWIPRSMTALERVVNLARLFRELSGSLEPAP